MKSVWQSSYALTDSKAFQPCGFVNLDRRSCRGERLQRTPQRVLATLPVTTIISFPRRCRFPPSSWN
jgi:hypothetical protein